MDSASHHPKCPPKEPSLSEVLRRKLITSPMLDWKNKKSSSTKNQEKLEVHNEKLFGFGNSRRKNWREAMKAEVDLSAAVRESLVRTKVKPDNHDIRKLKNETENSRKVNPRHGGGFPTKVDELYLKTLEPEGIDEPQKRSVAPEVNVNEQKQPVTPNNPSLRLLTFNTWSKEQSMFGTQYTNLLKSSEASRGSHSRFDGLMQLDSHPAKPGSSDTSSHALGISSSSRTRRSTWLNRQYSDINLAHSAISMSLASFKTLETTDGTLPDERSGKPCLGKGLSDCNFPGFGPGQHCHSVAATVLKGRAKEHKWSSSSSSDDVFESTRYAREILEEKFRGITFEKTKQRTGEITPAKEPKSKRKTPKTTKKLQCKCRATHGKCTEGASSKVSKVQAKDAKTDGKQPQLDKIGRSPGSGRNTSEKAAGAPLDNNGPKDELTLTEITLESIERPPPCNKETCASLGTEARKKDLMSPGFDPVAGSPDEGIKFTTDCSKRAVSKNTATAKPKSDLLDKDPCTSQTCLFSKSKESHTKHRKQKNHVRLRRHRSGYFRKSKKAICSYKTCKVPFGYPKYKFKGNKRREHYSKSRSSKSCSSSWQRKDKPYICNCQNLYTGGKYSSASDDIWMDADLKRAQTRRYKLSIEVTEPKKNAKCGGFAPGIADCSCYVCKVKKKPWTKYLKRHNTLIEIPYLLTPKTLGERDKQTSEMRKMLGDAFQWSEEDLKNFCTKHYTCKKPNTRKALLKENPYLMNICGKNTKSTKSQTTKPETGQEDQGRFGYFIDVLDDRLSIDEPCDSLQALAERAMYCKWQRDIADTKVNHFIENMPKQQSCHSNPTHFDPDRRTCYNPKLMERLVDLVQFNMKPDRKIHEFSFPPKLLKYEEPQLVGDTRTDMPEIKVLKEPSPLPTIYRDIFKTNKHDLRKLMDTLLPPLQWTDSMGFWEMKVSLEPDNAETNRSMISFLDENETLCHAINKKFCAGRYRLYFEVFEVIRQELLEYPERAFLLARIREEFLLTMLLYDGGLEMTLTSTTHLWKSAEAETEAVDIREVEYLEKDIRELKSYISETTALTYQLEKRAEELADVRGYLHEDNVKLYKKTNHQLNAQYDAIKAGFLYELD